MKRQANLYKLLFFFVVLFSFLIIKPSANAAQIKASNFQLFQENGKTRGRVTLSGDCLGGIPEYDYISVNAYLVKPGAAPPLLKTYYLSYYCPSGFSYGYGNCVSDEQLNGYLCDSFTLWSVVHRSNRPWMDPACSGYLCEETAPFNYTAEFDLPDSLISGCGGRTIITAQLNHQWGGPNAYWSAAIYLFSRFYDNGGLFDSIGDVFAEADYTCQNLLCKLSTLTVAKDIKFDQNVSYDGGITAEKKPFAGLRVRVDCGNGAEFWKIGDDGILHLNVGPCGCSVTVCDPRVINEYMYRVTVDSTDLYHLIPNDYENAKGYKRFADAKYFKGCQAVGSPTKFAVGLLTEIQKFNRGMDFHHYYLPAAREMRKDLLAKSSDCGSANYGDSETDQEKHLKQAKQIFGSVNTSHKRSAIGPKVEKDPASKPEDKFLSVLANGDDVLVTTMQDLVRVKLQAGYLDIHSTAILVAGDDGSYDVNVLSGFVVVHNAEGVAFSPALGPGSYGKVSSDGNLVEVNFGLSALPDFDQTMKVVTEDGDETLAGINDVARLFGNYRNSVDTGAGQFTYQDMGGLDLSGDASGMRPISFSYDYDNRIQVEVATPLFSEAVDLYLGIQAEPYGKMLVLNRFGRWTTELTPWKKLVKVVPFEIVLPSFSAAGMLSGDYKAYLFALPAGSDDFSKVTGWESVLTIYPETNETETIDDSILWSTGDTISLVSGDNKPQVTKKYSADEISLEDAHVYAYPYRNWDNANWGGSTQLMVSSQVDGLANTNARIYLKFDVAALQAEVASIDKAELVLDVFDGNTEFGNTKLEVFRALDEWGEGDHVYHSGQDEPDAASNTVSWSKQPGVDLSKSWSSVDISKGDGPFSIHFDITELLKSWLNGTYDNYGILIKGLENSSYRFYFPSSERDTDGTSFSKPYLVLSTSSATDSKLRTVTLTSAKDASSIDKCSYSFVRNAMETNPNLETYDILLESWCVDKPPFCGNFADIGVVDIASVDSYPSSGYVSDCTDDWNTSHTFISKNRDGSHTVFKITRHVKPGNCQHVVDISYRNLD